MLIWLLNTSSCPIFEVSFPGVTMLSGVRSFLEVGRDGLSATQSIKVTQVQKTICTVGVAGGEDYLFASHLGIFSAKQDGSIGQHTRVPSYIDSESGPTRSKAGLNLSRLSTIVTKCAILIERPVTCLARPFGLLYDFSSRRARIKE